MVLTIGLRSLCLHFWVLADNSFLYSEFWFFLCFPHPARLPVQVIVSTGSKKYLEVHYACRLARYVPWVSTPPKTKISNWMLGYCFRKLLNSHPFLTVGNPQNDGLCLTAALLFPSKSHASEFDWHIQVLIQLHWELQLEGNLGIGCLTFCNL